MSSAQIAIQPLLDPVVLPDYSRDRNVSVTEARHPDYDALGIDLGDFQAFPNLAETTQINSNVFLNDFNKHADVVQLIQPSVQIQSDWSSNSLQLYLTDQVRHDINYSIFNKNTWFGQLKGAVDVTDELNLSALLQAGHFTENPYSSAAISNLAVLSQYNQAVVTLRGVWTSGKMRLTAQYDHFSYEYSPLQSTAGDFSDQGYRDDRYNSGLVKGEYSISPSLAIYSQVNFDKTKYPFTSEFDQPNRNSTGVSFVSGFSLDLSGVARGALGLGYSHRAYDSGTFVNPSGLSVQAKIELFPSPATTLTGSVYRLLRDTGTGQSVSYYDSRVEFDVDHELRQNIIITAKIYYGNQDFLESSERRAFYQANFGGKIILNRRFNVDVELGYNKSTINNVAFGAPFGQFIGSVALQLKI